jgi:hypothetical protein
MSNVKEVKFEPACASIVKMLRQRADEIESGKADPRHAILVEYYGNGKVAVFGYGPALSAGQAYMTLDYAKRYFLDFGV